MGLLVLTDVRVTELLCCRLVQGDKTCAAPGDGSLQDRSKETLVSRVCWFALDFILDPSENKKL